MIESNFPNFINRVGYSERTQDQEEILAFVNEIFGDYQKIDLNEFKRINIEDSSEMLFAVSSFYLSDNVYSTWKSSLRSKLF